jgi:hypothetical protein
MRAGFVGYKDTSKLIFDMFIISAFSLTLESVIIFLYCARTALGFTQPLHQEILHVISPTLKRLDCESICLFPLQKFGALSIQHKLS